MTLDSLFFEGVEVDLTDFFGEVIERVRVTMHKLATAPFRPTQLALPANLTLFLGRSNSSWVSTCTL